MSRKWERMVSKNAKKANKSRLKQGIPPVSDSHRPPIFKGRSIILSIFFVVISIILLFTPMGTGKDSMYWFTTASYFLVGLLIYFVRRPYLKVGKTSLSKRGFSRESIINAENIKQISITPGNVVIELNGKSRWVYSKVLNRFDVAAIAGKLRGFSEQNQIAFVDKT
jgi:hypothetical protein